MHQGRRPGHEGKAAWAHRDNRQPSEPRRPDRTAYAGAKASLLGISRCLALELAPFGITVNLVSPGPVETSLFRIYHKPDDPSSSSC